MLVDLIENVVNAINEINEGVIPVIENSWNHITNNECSKSIRECNAYSKKSITDYQKENNKT